MADWIMTSDIEREEGLRLAAYWDPIGKCWTIGYGHTGPDVYKGLVWSLAEARAALQKDMAVAISALDVALPWWRTLDPVRGDVLAEMSFNMGIHTLLEFKNTLKAVQMHNYNLAYSGMLSSEWAAEVGHRATRLAEMMRSGVAT